jgi:hypothetical protein
MSVHHSLFGASATNASHQIVVDGGGGRVATLAAASDALQATHHISRATRSRPTRVPWA